MGEFFLNNKYSFFDKDLLSIPTIIGLILLFVIILKAPRILAVFQFF